GAATKKLKKENAECIKLLDEGKDVSDCHKAPSPVLPAGNEMVWGVISFSLLFFLLRKFAYPGIKKGMDTRAEKIRTTLDDADAEAGRIIEEARQAADAMRRDLRGRAEADATAVRERAQADIQTAVERALGEAREQVSALSMQAVELVLQRQLSDHDTQTRL